VQVGAKGNAIGGGIVMAQAPGLDVAAIDFNKFYIE
jgi:hypothetical protein